MGEEQWRRAALYHDQCQGEAFRGSLPVPLRTQGAASSSREGEWASASHPPSGELRTESCFWSRFCPAKNPTTRLQNLPDRLGTATRWWGTNLMVALGGAVATPFNRMGNVPRWEDPGELTSLHLLAPISHPSPSQPSDTLILLSRLSAFFFFRCSYTHPPAPTPVLFSVSISL